MSGATQFPLWIRQRGGSIVRAGGTAMGMLDDNFLQRLFEVQMQSFFSPGIWLPFACVSCSSDQGKETPVDAISANLLH